MSWEWDRMAYPRVDAPEANENADWRDADSGI